MRNYTLDTDAAKAENGGKNIRESGPYSGEIIAAWHETTQKNTEAVNLMFKADNGQTVGPLPIYTHNADGKTLPGYNTLNAIMACVRQRELKPSKGQVVLYDFEEKKDVTKTKDVFPALTGKKLGLLLQQEEYINKSGETKTRMIIVGSFEPSTKLMASEILNKETTPKALDKSTEWLAKNPIKRAKAIKTMPKHNGYEQHDHDPFEDDAVPF